MNRKKIVENRWVTFLEDEFRLPNGADITYYHAMRADAVMAIALDVGDDYLNTFIVKQHRHPIGKEIWQFPLGGIDEGVEDLNIIAQKELAEETGVIAVNFEHVGSFYADPGFTNQKLHVCISQTIQNIESQNLEASEYGLVCRKIAVNKIPDFIESGEMGDAWGIAGLHYINRYLAKYGMAIK